MNDLLFYVITFLSCASFANFIHWTYINFMNKFKNWYFSYKMYIVYHQEGTCIYLVLDFVFYIMFEELFSDTSFLCTPF